ncbi:MAG TPA: PHB depolymerase family esterase [Acidimicrobiales bacterium]|nr:PHB depolymerase family esterase [Acidimicrobiales bacterium]
MGRSRCAAAAAVALALVAACAGDGGDRGDGGRDEGAAPPEAGPPAAVPSAGCDGAGAQPRADLVEASLDIRGVARRYLLSAPATGEGDAPLPLVLDFHGLAEGADVHAGMTQLGPLGVEEGFVTVFPHGTGNPVLWDVGTDPAANADLAYVGALLDRVESERCVDTSRVYATGLSYGAMMASTVACTMADRVAAVAPIAGLALPEPCEPARPVPVLTVHGTADPILLFNGGIGTGVLGAALGGAEAAPTTTAPPDLDGAGYPDTVRRWAELDGCEVSSATDERVSDEVIRRTFDCPEDAPVEFLIVEGGGHSWPSSEFSRSIESVVGPTTTDIDASAEAWRFFQRFALVSP